MDSKDIPKGERYLLTINGGSSSLKFALFEAGPPVSRRLSGKIDRIGQPDAQLTAKDQDGEPLADDRAEAPDHRAAVGLLLAWLGHRTHLDQIVAIGHRIVHGGDRFVEPERVTAEVVEELRRIAPFAPNHLPSEIALIEALWELDPDRPQVVCFDTAFHHDLPRVAQIMPIPRRYEKLGVRRYGFHGLSYSYLMERLRELAGDEAAKGRVILAHLGAGASLAAVRDGKPVDTTMAFTPTAGLVMATRTGDIDPGLVGFLGESEGMSPAEFFRMAHHDSGLLGVSETSPDFRELLARSASDIRAAEAIDLFCYRIRQAIGGFAAALGGLDTLVFSGGIGENSAEARRRICQNLEFLGIKLDDERNNAQRPLVSTDCGSTAIRVIPTDEEATIAKATSDLLYSASTGSPAKPARV